ncbi:GNAT family N-acetyltransferase [soil metagenome]
MPRTPDGLRPLGPPDLPAMLELTARSPVVNVFAEYRTRLTRLDPRWLGGEVWGYYVAGALVSACHSAANLVPVEATSEAVRAFAGRTLEQPRRCATIVGPSPPVEQMWRVLEPSWGAAREHRPGQLHMERSGPPAVAADTAVRRSTSADLDVLYPACVAMYTEEVGVSPEAGGAAGLYRARVAQLIAKGWSFVRIEDGRVVFKAEIAAATPYACQVQGVYVAPDRRGEGLATAGMAAVVELALRDIAPVVALYTNAYNHAARRAYERVGFVQTDEFTTIMF